MSIKYTNIKSIPAHIFTNKELTITPSPELREYLEYMANNHPDDLRYLFNHCQQYKDHGGCYVLNFPRWLNKLKTDLNKQKKE